MLVAQKHGEQNNKAVSFILRDGLILGSVLVLPAFLLLWNMAPIFLLVGQSPIVVGLAQSYLHGLAWGLLPDFIMIVLLQFLIGLGHARVSMIFTLFWVPIAIFCNYSLIFGRFGLPPLGMAGIGWGMTLSYWITTICLSTYIFFNRAYKKYFDNVLSLEHPFFIKEILQVGVPMGAMYCIEVGFFLVLTLLMGRLGNQSLAANQIVLQYLGQLIAVVFSMAQAVTVRMGHMLGAKDVASAERASYAGIYVTVIFMMIVALCYWTFPEKLISIDLNIHDHDNVQIVAYAKQFFCNLCSISIA